MERGTRRDGTGVMTRKHKVVYGTEEDDVLETCTIRKKGPCVRRGEERVNKG